MISKVLSSTSLDKKRVKTPQILYLITESTDSWIHVQALCLIQHFSTMPLSKAQTRKHLILQVAKSINSQVPEEVPTNSIQALVLPPWWICSAYLKSTKQEINDACSIQFIQYVQTTCKFSQNRHRKRWVNFLHIPLSQHLGGLSLSSLEMTLPTSLDLELLVEAVLSFHKTHCTTWNEVFGNVAPLTLVKVCI